MPFSEKSPSVTYWGSRADHPSGAERRLLPADRLIDDALGGRPQKQVEYCFAEAAQSQREAKFHDSGNRAADPALCFMRRIKGAACQAKSVFASSGHPISYHTEEILKTLINY